MEARNLKRIEALIALAQSRGKTLGEITAELDLIKTAFMWSENLLYIIGRTRTGRATVGALNMNRSEHVNRKRLFQFAGEHPPTSERR